MQVVRSEQSGNEWDIHRQRLLSAGLLGVLPAGIAAMALPWGLEGSGTGLPRPGPSAAFVAWTLLLAVPILITFTKSPRVWQSYPQIRAQHWGWGLLARNAATWALYLGAYEFFFRGFLLFALERALGAPGAILATTALYVFAHLTKDRLECLSCVPMGILLGAAAIWTGSFWAPFGAHLGIALVAEFLAMQSNPQTRGVWDA